ncbi:hypothetical protein SODALDRAFT_327251 [Sodiomyces alkalinus F11]|uniref:Uncharacterized protein n=1 Tax=Sodiomyces alkalinus (strain CBS 110278 / VKM F-3762 / F11) TaxID=1314773 RepID=A0A3N2Q8I6_SODAK|nr:hypothetical protein SODALDRAFT_327251 [Sodiomyces alkalinus F11]ROT43084.1 hypothetical protein SODALDRAFT_327251 [Sodiomyces alkalinus F11]
MYFADLAGQQVTPPQISIPAKPPVGTRRKVDRGESEKGREMVGIVLLATRPPVCS